MEASEVAVRVLLRGGSAFKKEADEVADSVDNIGKAGKKADVGSAVGNGAIVAGKRFQSFGDKLDKAGKKITDLGRALMPVSGALGALGFYAIKAQSQFQKSMMLLVTQAGLPRRHLQALTKDVLNLAKAVGQSPGALADGLFPIISSGVHNSAQAIQLLRTSGIMAAVGGDTVDMTAKTLMAIRNTGFKGSAQQIAAYIEAAIGAGMMHMPELTSALGSSILPMVKMTGMKLPQILAAAAALTREGVPADSVMSRMRLSLTSVTSPTQAGIGAMQQMGLAQFALANDLRKPGGLLTMLQDLREHTLTKSPDVRNNLIAEIFGKSRGIGNIGALLNSLPQMQRIYSSVLAATPALLQQHFAETKTTNSFKWASLKASADKDLIELGQSIQRYLLPDVLKLIPFLTSLVNDFGKLPPGVQRTIVLLGGLVIVASPLLMIFGGLVRVIGAGVGGVGKLISGFGWLTKKTGILAGEEGFAGLEAESTGLLGAFTRLVPAVALAFAAFEAFKDVKHQVRLDKAAIENKPGARSRLLMNTMQNQWHGGTLGQINARSFPSEVIGLFNKIPGLASGGTVRSPGTVLIGEQGPELLSLPRGATVSPLPNQGVTSLRTRFADGSGQINLTTNVVLDGKVIATTVADIDRKRQNRK